MALAGRYDFLTKPPEAPLLVQAALKELGTLEGAGTANNPKIVKWADEVAQAMPTAYTKWAADWYNSDAVPWCGLFAAVCAVRSANGKVNRMPPKNYLSALAWADFGNPVQWRGREGLRLHEIMVGDVAVFVRQGGGHVAIIVGVTKDGSKVVCVGGNQANAASIAEFPLTRLYAIRRPPYKVHPLGARHVRLSSTGVVSTDEG